MNKPASSAWRYSILPPCCPLYGSRVPDPGPPTPRNGPFKKLHGLENRGRVILNSSALDQYISGMILQVRGGISEVQTKVRFVKKKHHPKRRNLLNGLFWFLFFGSRDYIYTWDISGKNCQLGDCMLPTTSTTCNKNLKIPLIDLQGQTHSLASLFGEGRLPYWGVVVFSKTWAIKKPGWMFQEVSKWSGSMADNLLINEFVGNITHWS